MEEETGLLVAENDGLALSEAMLRLVGNRELVGVVVAVEVVAEHDDEGEMARGVEVGEHRLRDRLLRLIAGAAVAHQGEHGAAANRRQRQRRGRARRQRCRRRGGARRRGLLGQRVRDVVDDHRCVAICS